MVRHYQRIARRPETSFFLFGPRGVGKSTWARQELPDALFVDLLDEGLYQRLLGNPELFEGIVRAAPEHGWVVVDEVQRIPHWCQALGS